MNTPLVSVIMPAYNCAGVISGAIDSALAQNVELEIIVIDDGSVDGLDSVMEQYKECPRVRFVKNEHNMGAAATRNRGVQLARGRYIAFLDADDLWIEGKLQKQLSKMQESGTVICATARELMNPEGESTGRVIGVPERFNYQDLLKHNCINCSSVLMEKEVAAEFPMHHEDSHEDYIMWLEILQKYHNACGVNEPLLKYRLSNTGKSGSKWKSAKMTFRVYRYMGFSWIQSIRCFISYAFHGIKKYFF